MTQPVVSHVFNRLGIFGTPPGSPIPPLLGEAEYIHVNHGRADESTMGCTTMQGLPNACSDITIHTPNSEEAEQALAAIVLSKHGRPFSSAGVSQFVASLQAV